MSSGVVKFYNTAEQIETKIIDSNARMDKRLQELKDAVPKVREIPHDEPTEEYVGDEFEDFDPAALEALTVDSQDETVIKANLEAEIEAAHAQADEIVATAEQLAQEYKENTRRETEIECNRMRANAQKEGYDEGIRQAQDEYAARMAAVDAKELELEQFYQAKIDELEPIFVSTLTDIYEHIFKVDLSEYQELVSRLVMDTMRRSDSSDVYIIHISSEDYPKITEDQKEELQLAASGSRVDIIEDIGLGRNQCLVETDNGIIDCGLDTQLRELKRKLLLLSYVPSMENAE